MKNNKIIRGLVVLGALVFMQVANAKEYLINTKAEFDDIKDGLQAGDNVVLTNGTWQDFEILFQGVGTKAEPITLSAQDKGQVIISGQSNLSLYGEHLIVSGLVFKNGHTPTGSIISFRKSKTEIANNSRVTEVVIDNFSNPERFDSDYWVALYGKRNRFDHNHLEGKRNKGVTMAVRLDTEESRENYHQIDHNYFGPRPIFGSNGGETLRIGTSHYSLTDSYTLVENNYFDRCDGELEVVSNKSGNNTFRGNVFFESRGTLTMRHGNDTLVEDNVFLGNGVDHTGGIRLINKRQTIRNNYMAGLAGYRFGGALVVMNGVPDSPINRYHQVEESFIEHNSIINSDHIQLAAGSDQERSAVPITTAFKHNLIHNNDAVDTFTIYDDISGIEFQGNAVNGVDDFKIKQGFATESFAVAVAENGLMYPQGSNGSRVGVASDLMPIRKNDTGVNWYPKPEKSETFGTGKIITLEPGLDKISHAVKDASDGDVIKLLPGEYVEPRLIAIDKAIRIEGEDAATTNVLFERSALFEIQNGGSLALHKMSISGASAPDSSGNSVIRTLRRSMLFNYQLELHSVVIEDLDINHSFNFLTVSKGSFADNIEITDSTFKNITGAVLSLDKESDDYGIYNAEYVTIINSTFDMIEGDLVDFYRGGTDESTFGPHFVLQGSTLISVGEGKRNKSQSSILLHGVQATKIDDNQIVDSPAIKVLHTVGEPVTTISNNKFHNTAEVVVEELNSDKDNTAIFVNNTYSQDAE